MQHPSNFRNGAGEEQAASLKWQDACSKSPRHNQHAPCDNSVQSSIHLLPPHISSCIYTSMTQAYTFHTSILDTLLLPVPLPPFCC